MKGIAAQTHSIHATNIENTVVAASVAAVAAVSTGPELPGDGNLVRVRHVAHRPVHGSLICAGTQRAGHGKRSRVRRKEARGERITSIDCRREA